MTKVPQPETGATDLSVRITNCNSIDQAVISLRPGSLNIKYGPNGIGKSTVARAITLQATDPASLAELTPFKLRATANSPAPRVDGAETITSVLTFDDAYVQQFVFQRDEVLKNSFEIFINTDEYRAGIEQIEALFEALMHTFIEQEEFNEALSSFSELREAFNLTKGGAVAKNSRGYKALTVAGKLNSIPEDLQGFSHFLHSASPADWITWQSKGKTFLDLSENCPFCSAANVNKTVAARVSEEYESSAVKNMSALRAGVDRLGRYFEPGVLTQLETLLGTITELSPEQENFIATLSGEIETFLQKLVTVRNLSFYALRDEENVEQVLGNLKVDLAYLLTLKSEPTTSVVTLINEKLDEVAARINEVKRQIGEQKTRVARLIKANQDAINEFLRSGGYRYAVRIEAQGLSYRMLLEHQDAPGHLESASKHLSYGEKNAFALVLFMHQVQHDKPALVVLDDPVSSFDKTKKFAILHQLFHGKNSLRGFTSLLLTHDIEPAIDIVRTGTSSQFDAAKPVVHFLNSKSGVVMEKPIEASDITTFSEVCSANIAAETDPIIKCIYLRRLFETHGSTGLGYEVLSNLLHGRDTPIKLLGGGHQIDLTTEEIGAATDVIREHIPDFDYAALLADLKNPGSLKSKFESTDVGYEKVQIFRVMSTLTPEGLQGDDVFRKFVNETYHIENEYVMQLNPREFDAVPEFIITSCSDLVTAP